MRIAFLALVGLSLCAIRVEAASAEGKALLKWVTYLMYNSPRSASGFICELEIGPFKALTNVYQYKVKLSQYKCDNHGLKREILESGNVITGHVEGQVMEEVFDITEEIAIDDKEREDGEDQIQKADLLFLEDIMRSSLTDEELRDELIAALDEFMELIGEPVLNMTEKRFALFTQTCTWNLKDAAYLKSIGRTKGATLLLRIRNVLSHTGNVKLMRDAMHDKVLHQAVDRLSFCSGLTYYVKYPTRYPKIFG